MHSARLLRATETPAESAFWELVRAKRLGFKFRRQHAIAGFVADFCCVEARVVVEIDGTAHVGREEADAERTRVLEAHGYRVVRFANETVLRRIDFVRASLLRLLDDAVVPEFVDAPRAPEREDGELPLPTASLRAPVGRGPGGEVVDDVAPVSTRPRTRP